MNKALKILLWLGGIIVLLGIGLVVLVTMVVDPNEYKQDISQLVEKHTGRRLNIGGELDLTFFPWLGVRTGRLELSNPPEFSEDNMLTVEKAEIRVKLLPLLSKNFQVDTIVLVEPVAHLIVDAGGANNWQDLAGPGEGEPAASSSAMGALAIEGVDLSGGKLIFEDRQSGVTHVFDAVNLNTGEVMSQQPVNVELGFEYSSDRLQQPLALRLDSMLKLNIDAGTIHLTGAVVGLENESVGRVETKFDLLTVDLAKSTAEAGNMSIAGQLLTDDQEQAVVVTADTGLKANMQNELVQLGKTTANIELGSRGKADVVFGGLLYDLAASTIDVVGFNADGVFSDAALAQPITTKVTAGLQVSLNDDLVRLNDVQTQISYGSLGRADMQTASIVYDLTQSVVAADQLDLDGSYSAPELDQPVTATANTALKLRLVDNILELSRLSAQTRYGSLGHADVHMASMTYDPNQSKVTTDELKLDGSYTVPALDQTLTLLVSTGLTADLAGNRILLSEAKGNAGYGSLAKADLQVTALSYDLARSMIVAEGLTADGEYVIPDSEQQATAKISTQLTADLDQGLFELTDMTAQGQYQPIGSAGVQAGALRYDQPRSLLDATAFRFDGKYERHDIQSIFSDLSVDIGNQKASMPAFEMTIDGVEATVDAEISNFLEDAQYKGTVQTKPFRPSELLDRFDLDMEANDPDAFKNAALTTRFEGSTGGVRLDAIDARLDDTKVTGFVEVDDFDQPAYRFEIAVDSIDVDRYTPARSEGADTGAAVVVLPVDMFRGLVADGRLSVGQLKISGVRTSDIEIGVMSTAKGVTVKPMKADLYGGTLQGELVFIEQQGGKAILELTQIMEQVEMGPLLTDTGVTDRIEGRGRLALSIKTEETAGQPETDGSAEFSFFDGAIRGLNLRKIYLQAKQVYNERRGREQEVVSDDSEEFRFTEMTGTLVFNERVASNNDLSIKSPLFRISGEGQADLQANELNYLINATVVESAKGQGGEELSELKGVNLPIRVTGRLEAPVYQLDVAQILKGAVQNQIDKETKKLEQKLEKKIEQKLGDELQKLLKIN